jgi:hypothetical protein
MVALSHRVGRTRPLGRVLLVATVLVLAGCTSKPAPPPTVDSHCAKLQQRYGFCPPETIPVESPVVKNLDPKLSDADAKKLTDAYLRSRALYYLAIDANSDRFFSAGVIDVNDETPMMFDSESSHIKDAHGRGGKVVLVSRSTLKKLTVVPLPDDLRDSLDLPTKPLADALVITVAGPEQQVIRISGQPDEPVSTLGEGDGFNLLLGGVLVTKDGLPQTFAELGQWECLDPDTHGACQLPPAAPSG